MLEVRDISFGYSPRHLVLKGFSAAFGAHERVCISAPSGVGKTTLCRILASYLKPRSGQVLLDGKPLPENGVCPVQMIGQHPELAFDPRLRMERSLSEGGEQDLHLMDSIGIRRAWLRKFPHELSGGELQRLAICRAMMCNPLYLVADEISAMLDAITQAQIWEFLIEESKARGMGIVFVSHSPALASRIATQMIELGVI